MKCLGELMALSAYLMAVSKNKKIKIKMGVGNEGFAAD